ncbi:hypothetical protein AR546_03365 [Leptospira interrogans serovar Canicola]|nr:hypothetical protein B2G47_20595 [Leptospira interrogans serovar Canicola]OLZ32741.1 hypothetical protein AR546_03365 [Leptospira interrogans serovar Canicola]OMH62064.1 hypothetical protein BW243_20055 [Leptospira interrogans serovar Pomona]POR19975.1 hypothetical protein B0T34_02720 [Leptospira interrogans serovar Canicola]
MYLKSGFADLVKLTLTCKLFVSKTKLKIVNSCSLKKCSSTNNANKLCAQKTRLKDKITGKNEKL